MTLTTRLVEELERRAARPDAAQLRAASCLEDIACRLSDRRSRRGILSRLTARFASIEPQRGAYLWGGVGRGKTLLLDTFARELNVPFRRVHFHRFIQEVHTRLNALRDEGIPDPLSRVASEIASGIDALLFDELFVEDIADAMLLGGLFSALVEHRVVFVFTSNVPPAGLYSGGLQRSRFLPTIALLERETTVIEVDTGTDYRLRELERAPLLIPIDEDADAQLERRFADLSPGVVSAAPLDVEGRTIPVLRRADGVAWFDFATLCQGARSTADYIEIARAYHTVLVSGVPQLGADENAARRFIALIDEFYERGVKFVASVAAPIDELYNGTHLSHEFRRTASRLHEMQSRAYLARPHRP